MGLYGTQSAQVSVSFFIFYNTISQQANFYNLKELE